MPYSNPITTQEQQDLARYNPLHPRDGSANELYMPPAYFLVPPATQAGPVRWRLFDAAYISTGIIDPNRLGTGATGAGNLYLADDGTWKPVAGGGGGGDMYKATYDVDNDGTVDSAERIEIIVRNSTGSTLTKGTVVYLSGATGNRPNAVRAQADTEATSSKTFGIVVADINNNSDGYVACNGTLHDLDTSAFADGAALWLSATTAGAYTSTIPAEPNHTVFIGYIARSHPTQGRLVILIQNGYELNELHGVLISSEANNDLLVYESSTSLWKNKTISTIFGGTPLVSVPTLAQVTTAGNTTTNAITVGGLTVATNLIYTDTVNGRVGIGTVTPSVALEAIGSNFKFGRSSTVDFDIQNTGTARYLRLSVGTSDVTIQNLGSYDIGFNNNFNRVMTLKPTGNVLIGTTTDAGYKLDVNGTLRTSDTLIKGSGNTSSTTALSTQNSDGTLMFSVRNDRVVRLLSRVDFGNVQFYPINDGAYTLASNASQLRVETVFVNGTTTGDFGFSFGTFSAQESSNANVKSVIHTGSFAPTSGTKTYTTTEIRGTINQTGGANGITRGLHVIPALTAAADWRSIEWSNSTGWGLYGAGTANNYLAGALGIGSTTLTDNSLKIARAISTSFPYVFVQEGTVQSTASQVRSITSIARTQATAFTLSLYIHFNAAQATLGAGSAITSQYGYLAESNLTGATNNFGFYGDIPSGTNRWNLYMNGTAANYLNGNTIIGSSATDAGFKLDVNGTSRFQGSVTNTSGGFIANLSSPSSDAFYTIVTGGIGFYTSNQYTKAQRLNLTNATGSPTAPNNVLSVSGSITASSALAAGVFFNNTLVAAANNDVLVGLDINPTFTNGAFTGVSNLAARIQGNTEISRTGADTQLTVARGGGASFTIQGKVNSTSQSEGVNLYWTNNTWLKFVLGSSVVANFSNVGNLLVGTSTDAGFKLDVNGTARVSGQITIKGTTNNDTTNIFRVEQQNGNGRFLVNAAGQVVIAGDNFQSTENFIAIGRVFNPTSGTTTHTTLLVSPTINQTGGANGITRGLYIYPIITAAADFRAIETTAGKVIHQGLTNATQTSQVYYNTTTGELTYGALPTPTTPTLAQVTTAGNTTTNSITVGGLTVDTTTLVVDSTNDRVGIGTASPSQRLHVSGNVFIRGTDSLSATKVFEVQNGAGESIMDFRNSTYAFFGCGQGGGSASGFIFRYSDTNATQFTGYNYGNGTSPSYKPILMDSDVVGRNQGIYINYGSVGQTNPFPSDTEFAVRGKASTYVARFESSTVSALLYIRENGNVLIGTSTDGGYRLDVNGSFRTNGDSYVISANGRVFGFDGLSAGQTLHFQYGGDSNHRISTTYGSAAQMDAYHGLIIRTSPASGGKALIVNQRNSAHFIQEWQENGTQKAYINSQGNLYLAQLDAGADGPVISTSGLLSSVAGYTGTVTIQQPAPLPPINIDVQNGIIVNVF